MSDFTVDLEGLSEEEELELYGHKTLWEVPDNMSKFGIRIEHPVIGKKGIFVLVALELSSIEQQHQIIVLDEHDNVLRDIGVGFFYPGGDGPTEYPAIRRNFWRGSPVVNPTGNWELTDGAGYAQHTIHAGGETMMCWDIKDGILELPSSIAFNCRWMDNSKEGSQEMPFLHTCVRAVFQRRLSDVRPLSKSHIAKRLDALEAKVNT